MADMWTTIAAERAALAEDLAGLPAEAWRTKSLCDSWTVEEVLAHMTSTAQMTPPKFMAGFVGSGFSFPKFSEKGIASQRGADPAGTLANFRKQQDSTKSPPGPKTTWLGETIIHADDIRRPLGITHEYPTDAVQQVLDFYKNSNALIGSKSRIDGVTLRATDAEWSHGDGPVVEGRLIDLAVAATGRKEALSSLTGAGMETFASKWG